MTGHAIPKTTPSRPRGAAGRGADPSIAAVRAALEGPVIEVVWRELPALRSLPRAAVYPAVMNDPRLLDECFRLFRSRPDLFASVVTDGHRRPVTSDETVLSCGRSLADAIALVVRAAARRYFRRRLDDRVRPAAAAPPRRSFWGRLGIRLGLAKAPAVAPAAKRAPSRADTLFRALKDYLRFDWQVPLIPFYVPLAPSLINDIGPRLLDIREAAELRALSAPVGAARDGRPPLLLDSAHRLMVPGHDSIDPEILWRVVQQMDLARLFDQDDSERVRRAVAQVSAVNGAVLQVLIPVLGSDIRRFTVFLMVAFVTLGDQRFKQDFCQEGRSHAVRAVVGRLGQLPVPPPRLDSMVELYRSVLEHFPSEGAAEGNALLQAHPDLVTALDALARSAASSALR